MLSSYLERLYSKDLYHSFVTVRHRAQIRVTSAGGTGGTLILIMFFGGREVVCRVIDSPPRLHRRDGAALGLSGELSPTKGAHVRARAPCSESPHCGPVWNLGDWCVDVRGDVDNDFNLCISVFSLVNWECFLL